MPRVSVSTRDYRRFVAMLKERITSARIAASRAVNRELILLYWDIGREILDKQARLGWGESVVEWLSADLQAAFPGTTGFSARNLWDMRRFHSEYVSPEFLRQAVAEFGPAGVTEKLRQLVAEIPWGHHLLILNKVEAPRARLHYLLSTARFGWSRNVLLNQIKAKAFERGHVVFKAHNFRGALPAHIAQQADEALKSAYSLEFLGIERAMHERDLESHLLSKLQDFILELGYGFCFIGRQYRLTLGAKEYFVDLLFYHRFLKALVAVELKVGPFLPEYAGKMDFYLNLLNAKDKAPEDHPSIGIILCAEKDNLEVEFSLKTKANPIGVAEYQFVPKLPAGLKGKLPSAQQLTAALRTEVLRAKPKRGRARPSMPRSR